MLKQPIKLKCPKCGYEWWYKGSSVYYASCSKCKFSLNIKNKFRGEKK